MSLPPAASRLARTLTAPGLLLATGCLCAGGCGFSLRGLTESAPRAEAAATAKTGAAGPAVPSRPETPAAKAPQAFKVVPRSWQATVRSQGGLIADELAVIGARMAGRITEVAVEVGQPVTAGEVLVRLDEAEATLAAGMQQVEEKVALVKVQRTTLALARETLEQSVVKAPFDGVVQSRHGSSPGASVQLGDPLVTLVRTDPLRFRGTVPERQSLKLRVGQPVLVRLDSAAKPIASTVARIAPLLDEMSRTLTFEADIPNPEGYLRSGLFAEADVVVDEQAQALVVPLTSVREFAGREKVWRVEAGGRSRSVSVRTGRRAEGFVEIVSGLSPGDFVVHDATRAAGAGFSH
jgi:membrane fusion protein (multidrug efflux system)